MTDIPPAPRRRLRFPDESPTTYPRLERAWKHFSRNITKVFTGPNYENLRELDKLLVKVETIGASATPANLRPAQLAHGQFNFSWLALLSEEDFRKLNDEWLATLQRALKSFNPDRRSARVLPEERRLLLDDLGPSPRQDPGPKRWAYAARGGPGYGDMWADLQGIKDRYRALGYAQAKTFLNGLKEWYDKPGLYQKYIDEPLFMNKYFGAWNTRRDAKDLAYEHMQAEGPANATQRRILVEKGLWKLLKGAGELALDAVKIAALDWAAIRDLMRRSAGLINTLGGLLAGFHDWWKGNAADCRPLSARLGLDQWLDRTYKQLMGKDQEAIGEQLARGPHRLERGAALFSEELKKLEWETRYARDWMAIYAADLLLIKNELANPTLNNLLRDQLSEFAKDPAVSAQVLALETADSNRREELKRQADELHGKYQELVHILGRDLDKLRDYRAAIDTRHGLAAAQRAAVGTGLGFGAQQTLAQQAAAFDKSKLKHVETRERLGPVVDPTFDEGVKLPKSKLGDAAKKEIDILSEMWEAQARAQLGFVARPRSGPGRKT